MLDSSNKPLQPVPSTPRFEHHPDGFGIGNSRPRLSWSFFYPADADLKSVGSWTQRAYDIEIKAEDAAGSGTHHIESSESALVPWPGADLISKEAVIIRVRGYGQEKDDITQWSSWASAEAGLFERERWSALPIASSKKFEAEDVTLRPLRFRKEFTVPLERDILKARLYITAFGVYEAHINGSRVGDHVLAPGWTSYHHRLAYQIFDVTALVKKGQNSIGADVGEGWYGGLIGIRGGQRFNYGKELALLAQLEITLDNGEVMVKHTDHSWQCHTSAITNSEIYNGETYDMREEQYGWEMPGFDSTAWASVKELPFTSASMIASDMAPTRVTEEVKPVSITITPSGKTIFDFGQNVVGFVRIKRLPPHSKVSLVHAEVLVDQEMGMRPLRNAKCTDTAITADNELLHWCPKFTYHGFRYMQVNGWPEGTTPSLEDFTALVTHTDMKRRGWFKCSNDLVNKLHANIVWGMRGNFVSVPTDCPQRDERLGWTGDIQVFGPAANFLYDTNGILGNWLADFSAEQLARDDKIPPLICPDVMSSWWTPTPQAIWHDATILVPYNLYQASGDIFLLRRQYVSMTSWLDTAIRRGSDRLWDPTLWQLGDWVDPAAPPSQPGLGRTDGVLVADAYLVYVTGILADISALLGEAHDARRYAADKEKLKAAFAHRYITPAGNLANYTQAAIALAVQFDLYPTAAQRDNAAVALMRLVKTAQDHVSTGFAGTPAILPALTRTGQPWLAYRMLMEKHCPSWLYPLTMGATTIWERWDALMPDGSLNPGQMLSFNHYALGSVAAWLHETVGGLVSSDGWRTIDVRPVPGGGLTWAETRFDGPFGVVEAKWRVEGSRFKLELQVPPNSRAIIVLPMQKKELGKKKKIKVASGWHAFDVEFEPDEWPPTGSINKYSGPLSKACDCF
ncbi:hypothetical protein VE04_06928 [Pseudogymnoascus sp. 24MN13]|nr:hypothetical protein VE04_06928 [Pseudogymnoascus sp. 24MN13]